MKKQNSLGMKIIQRILAFMLIGSFLFFILGEVFLPAENHLEETTFQTFEANWVHVKEDGTEEPFAVPGTCETGHGEWAIIQMDISEEHVPTYICMRSMQQDLKIYVGDELREEYSTLATQPFGKTSTMTYVFFPLEKEDAGKTLRIEFMSDSVYSGYVSTMYMGEMSDITTHFYATYGLSTIVAILMFFIGFLVVGGSIFIWFVYKRKIDLLHLGNAIMILSMWLIVESKLRQFLFPNSTIAMLMGFLLIAILPYPFTCYLNVIQGYRYKKAYTVLAVVTMLNFATVVTLQILNIKDFFEVMTSSHILILALILTMAITIGRDIVKGHLKEYSEVAIGIAGLMVAGVVEIGFSYIVSARFNGIPLCISLVILLIGAGLKTVRDLLNIEKDKQVAIAASESKAQFLANMSHEIRTPINTVIGMNEMILRENTNEDIEEYSRSIKSASHMLLSLINDVLDFSKIEAGKLQLVENDYNTANLLKDIVHGIQVRAQQKGLKFVTDFDEQLPSVLKGDEVRIKQILNNLLSNAVKYTEKGSVTFAAKSVRSKDGFTLVLSVTDTGMGIKEEDMDKLFDSFQRLELNKNRYIEGTGLGLNITQKLVQVMQGTIKVDSEYGKGSCFTISIPQGVVKDEPMGQYDKKTSVDLDKKSSQKNFLQIPDAKILVVDDTQMNLMVMKALLKRTGAQLDLAPGGNECLEMTKDKKYDLILMDHMMPEPDGIETFHMLQADNNNPNQNTPVVVLTANAIEGMKEQYLQDGFADYLSKPVEADKLEEVLGRFLG